MEIITISNIKIEVHKKNIKNLYLAVIPPEGRARVSAPKKMRDEDIKIFIIKKLDWIRQKQEKYINKSKLYEYKYVSGENIYLWGEKYELQVVNSNTKSEIKINENKLILKVNEDSTIDERLKLINEWYRHNIKQEIPELLEKWQKIIGVTASEWHVKNMKTRWGTCNIRDTRIWLNLQLAKKHPKCLEYVVVHELVHLLEGSHNRIFKNYMDKFLPNWRLIKKQLNSNI